MERVILHCDLNNFYASVECILNPELKEVPMAVCGSVEERKGIVLAKNQIAKGFGIVTAETVHQALKKCPKLVIVPPRFHLYSRYSSVVRKIYERFTDYVENFGLDECWMDVTGSCNLYGDGVAIAEEIRRQVKDETGLTISVGVSFNKIFAKLGSDLKKPDAVTVISTGDFKQKIWGLPVRELLGVGRSTEEKLKKVGINTIGKLAESKPETLGYLLGKNGYVLWKYANGQDESRVLHRETGIPPKSIGHGTTLPQNLTSDKEVWSILFELMQDVSARLLENRVKASGIQIGIKDSELRTVEFQKSLHYATKSSIELSKEAMSLFRQKYSWTLPIRAVTVRAIMLLQDEDAAEQLSLFDATNAHAVYDGLENVVCRIRKIHGKGAVSYATLMKNGKVRKHREAETEVLPAQMYR